MRCTAARWPAALLVSALAATARAEPSPGGGAPFPPFALGVELHLSPRAARTYFTYLGTAGLLSAPDPGLAIPVAEHARLEYGAIAARAFRRMEPEAELEIQEIAADVDYDDAGWHADVEHALVLRARGGGVIARWKVSGHGRILGVGRSAMPLAFERAAAEAARRFELALATSPELASWLRTRPPPAPPAAVAAPPPAAGATEDPRRAWRDGPALYADLGLGLRRQTYGGYETETQGAFVARVGASMRGVFLQLSFSRAEGGVVPGTAETRAGGVDGGFDLVIADGVELVAGGGLQSTRFHVRDRASQSSVRTGEVWSALFGVRAARVKSSGRARLRVAAELRQELGGLRRFGTGWGAVEVGPAFTGTLLVGIEGSLLGP